MGEVIRKMKDGRFLGWYLRYVDSDGKRKQRASHQPSAALARRMLVEIEARIARGRAGLEEPSRTELTLAELIERFCNGYDSPRLKSPPRYRAQAKKILQRILRQAPTVARLRLSALSARDIERARGFLLERYREANTVRSTLQTLSAALSWAVAQGLMAANPARGVKLPASPPNRLEFLSRDEARRLLDVAEQRMRGASGHKRLCLGSRFIAVALGLYAGLRRGEIYGLRWQDLDTTARRLTVARSYGLLPKSGKLRHLRLPDALAPLLEAWRPHCPPTREGLVCPVFGRHAWGMSSEAAEHGLKSLLVEARCPALRGWHGLRHTFASLYVMSGGSLLALKEILGHANPRTSMIYAHLGPDFLGNEMNRVKI